MLILHYALSQTFEKQFTQSKKFRSGIFLKIKFKELH